MSTDLFDHACIQPPWGQATIINLESLTVEHMLLAGKHIASPKLFLYFLFCHIII